MLGSQLALHDLCQASARLAAAVEVDECDEGHLIGAGERLRRRCDALRGERGVLLDLLLRGQVARRLHEVRAVGVLAVELGRGVRGVLTVAVGAHALACSGEDDGRVLRGQRNVEHSGARAAARARGGSYHRPARLPAEPLGSGDLAGESAALEPIGGQRRLRALSLHPALGLAQGVGVGRHQTRANVVIAVGRRGGGVRVLGPRRAEHEERRREWEDEGSEDEGDRGEKHGRWVGCNGDQRWRGPIHYSVTLTSRVGATALVIREWTQ